ncbi:MAG: DUF222 domain-containing protein, partial [Actinomycetota bacterium]
MAQPSLADIRESFRSDRIELTDGLRAGQAALGALHLEQLRWAVACDNAEVWREDGAKSTGEWLARELGVSSWKAYRMIHSGRGLDNLPYISACLANGSLSLDKVLELTRFAEPDTERRLVAWARRVTPGGIRDRADKLAAKKIEEVKEVFAARSVSWSHTLDGHTLHLEAILPVEQGALVTAAVDRIAETLPDLPADEGKLPVEREYTIYQRRADALVSLATARLASDHDPDIATVVVNVPLAALLSDGDDSEENVSGERRGGGTGGGETAFGGWSLDREHAELDLGPSLHALTAQRLSCDCRLEVASLDGQGRTVGSTSATRVIPRWLRRRLMKRDDHTCQFPGCGATRFLHAHHIVHWIRGGPTELDNLLALCSTHHTLVHEFGWSVTLSSSGAVTWFRPSGRVCDPGPPLPSPGEVARGTPPRDP